MTEREEIESVIAQVNDALLDPRYSDEDSQNIITKIRNELYRVFLEPGAIFSAVVSFTSMDSSIDHDAPFYVAYQDWLHGHWPEGEFARQRNSHKSELSTAELIELAFQTKNSALFKQEPFIGLAPLFDEIVEEIKRIDSDRKLNFSHELAMRAYTSIPLGLPFMSALSVWKVVRREGSRQPKA